MENKENEWLRERERGSKQASKSCRPFRYKLPFGLGKHVRYTFFQCMHTCVSYLVFMHFECCIPDSFKLLSIPSHTNRSTRLEVFPNDWQSYAKLGHITGGIFTHFCGEHIDNMLSTLPAIARTDFACAQKSHTSSSVEGMFMKDSLHLAFLLSDTCPCYIWLFLSLYSGCSFFFSLRAHTLHQPAYPGTCLYITSEVDAWLSCTVLKWPLFMVMCILSINLN